MPFIYPLLLGRRLYEYCSLIAIYFHLSFFPMPMVEIPGHQQPNIYIFPHVVSVKHFAHGGVKIFNILAPKIVQFIAWCQAHIDYTMILQCFRKSTFKCCLKSLIKKSESLQSQLSMIQEKRKKTVNEKSVLM